MIAKNDHPEPTPHPQPEEQALPALEPTLAVRGLHFKRRLLVSLLLCGLPFVILMGIWRLGGASALEDDLIYYLPIRQYIGEQIAAGHWPTWNPLSNIGTSIAADPQAGLWYPATWLFAVTDPLVAYPLTIIFHAILAGAGLYRFLRAERLDWRAALLGAIAFEFCGFMVAQRAHLTIHHAAAWLPWMLYAWRRFADTRKYRYFALACVCLGLQMLVQHIQITVISCVLLTGYVIIVLGPRKWALLWQFPLGLAIGALLAGLQLLPTWFYFAGSGRATPAWYLFVENSWLPGSALMFLFPMFFGARTPNLWEQPWWGLSHFCEQSPYASILILLLAIASAGLIFRKRQVAFWWLALIAAIALGLGQFTPLSKALFHVPIYRNFRVPARWLLVVSIALPILAAYTTSALLTAGPLLERARKWARASTIVVLPLLALLGLGLMLAARLLLPRLEAVYNGPYAELFWRGVRYSVRPENPAIWWPILLITVTCLMTFFWLRRPAGRLLPLLFLVMIADLASVAAFVDVDTRSYKKADLREPPELAETLHKLEPHPGDRLLVPRYYADYRRPIEVLWPNTNMLFDIDVFNGYGPFWSPEHRRLLRFQPWGSSEEMLSLLRNVPLMQSLGIRFIAARSNEERALLRAALLPGLQQPEVQEIPDTSAMADVAFGQDILWPVRIDRPGIYKLSFQAEPVAGSPSRWFVRIEDARVEGLTRTRALEPVDLTDGRRDINFLFNISQTCPDAFVRIKAEMGRALAVRNGTLTRIAGPDGTVKPPLEYRFDLLDGITLFEVPDTVPLVRLTREVTTVATISMAMNILQNHSAEAGLPERAIIVDTTENLVGPADDNDRLTWQRPTADRLEIEVEALHPRLLVFNESFAPGWRATIDGRPTDIRPANILCQGIAVPAGRHRVILSYHPPGLYEGLIATLLGLVLLATGAIIGLRKAYKPSAKGH